MIFNNNISAIGTTNIDEIKNIKTISIINSILIVLIVIDIFYCFVTNRIPFMYSSIFLLAALLISRFFLYKNKLEIATLVTAIGSYFIAAYHSFSLDNIEVSYIILLVTPILCAVILSEFLIKILFLLLSIALLPLFNFWVGNELFDNYFLYVGLIPSFFGMLYFYNRLNLLEVERKGMIDKLKKNNDEVILYSYMMSHDLKAPLRSISGFSEVLLKKSDKLNDIEKECLGFIKSNTKTMQILIEDLMLYAKTENEDYEFEIIDLNNLIEEQKKLFHYEIEEKQVSFDIDDLGQIRGNKSALKTVFQNLISNSIKYQPLDEPNHTPHISIKLKTDNGVKEILFIDNGIGIEDENIDKLFIPFRRFHSNSKYKGSGLGMSICKKILNKHNGDIKYVNLQNGQGACFLITLPK